MAVFKVFVIYVLYVRSVIMYTNIFAVCCMLRFAEDFNSANEILENSKAIFCARNVHVQCAIGQTSINTIWPNVLRNVECSGNINDQRHEKISQPARPARHRRMQAQSARWECAHVYGANLQKKTLIYTTIFPSLPPRRWFLMCIAQPHGAHITHVTYIITPLLLA